MSNELWIVGRCKYGILAKSGLTQWEFAGVFDSEDDAIAVCKDDTYFVGPAILNEVVPDRTTAWPGAFYPLAK